MIAACPRDCYDTCFFKVVKMGVDYRLEPIPEPFGVIAHCPRAAADFLRARSRDRVLYPHVRREGGFERVSWDEALNLLVNELKNVLEVHGSEKVLFLEYAGNMGLITRLLSRRLWYLIGAAMTDGSICDEGGYNALKLHYGSSYGADVEDLYEAELFIYWGFNPALTSIHNYKILLERRKRDDVKVIVVDPIKTQTAKIADLWLRPKPGSDIYLALGIANYLISNNLVDMDFIKENTFGFEKFAGYVRKFDLDTVSKATGIPKFQIVDFAEMFWRYKPSIVFIGYGLQRRIGGSEAVRAISLLPALIGLHRGFYYSNTDGLLIDMNYIAGTHLGKPSRIIPQYKLGEFLERGEFKFVYIHLTNPAKSYPNAGAIIRGLSRSDVFVVVHETHWSETAKLADLVLPAPTWLEKDDFMRSYWHTYIAYTKKILEPLGESRDEVWLMREIAKRLGIDNGEVFENPFDVIKKAIGEEIFSKVIERGFYKLPYKAKNEYQTPSGKIEFFSQIAEKIGVHPLPKPVEWNLEPDEFNLITSSDIRYTNSQFRDVYGEPKPIVWMSREDMEEYGLREGDVIVLVNDYGSLELIVKQSDVVPRRTLLALKQTTSLDRKPINEITSDEKSELFGATINSTKVRIKKVEQN